MAKALTHSHIFPIFEQSYCYWSICAQLPDQLLPSYAAQKTLGVFGGRKGMCRQNKKITHDNNRVTQYNLYQTYI